MKLFVVLFLFIIGLVISALNIHIVQLDNSFEFLVKTEMTFEDTYVDARGANKIKLLSNPKLIEAGINKLLNERKG